MNRRSFLMTTTAVGGVATSGCLGYSIVESETVNDRRDRIEELESVISERNETVEQLETEISELNETNSNLSADLSQVESDLETTREKQVLYLYGYGITMYNGGIDYYNSGYRRLQQSNYRGSRADFNAASGYFDSASVSFSGAKERATEINASVVRQYCSDAEQKSEAMWNAMGSYQRGVQYYLNGQQSRADSTISTGDSYYQDAQSFEVKDRSALSEQLGATIETEGTSIEA